MNYLDNSPQRLKDEIIKKQDEAIKDLKDKILELESNEKVCEQCKRALTHYCPRCDQ